MANEVSQQRQYIRLFGKIIYILCAIGILLSVYALYVEIHAEGDSKFKAWCDINSKMSCSKVFTSRFGRGFGLLEYVVGRESILNQPNSIFGISFYIIQLFCAWNISSSLSSIGLKTSVLANFGSVYLAFILVYVLEDLCVVCCSTYIVNAVILFCCYQRHKTIVQLIKEKKKT